MPHEGLIKGPSGPFSFVLQTVRFPRRLRTVPPAWRAGFETKLPFKVHPHMLRHACGYALANKGVDTRTLQGFLGHRSIQSTVRTGTRTV
jgi:integrase